MGLDGLRRSLLYNNVLDVWIALCEEKGWDWFDTEGYSRLLEYLKNEGIPLKDVPVCVEETGRKAAFVKTYASKTRQLFKVNVIRADDSTVEKLRAFER